MYGNAKKLLKKKSKNKNKTKKQAQANFDRVKFNSSALESKMPDNGLCNTLL